MIELHALGHVLLVIVLLLEVLPDIHVVFVLLHHLGVPLSLVVFLLLVLILIVLVVALLALAARPALLPARETTTVLFQTVGFLAGTSGSRVLRVFPQGQLLLGGFLRLPPISILPVVGVLTRLALAIVGVAALLR